MDRRQRRATDRFLKDKSKRPRQKLSRPRKGDDLEYITLDVEEDTLTRVALRAMREPANHAEYLHASNALSQLLFEMAEDNDILFEIPSSIRTVTWLRLLGPTKEEPWAEIHGIPLYESDFEIPDDSILDIRNTLYSRWREIMDIPLPQPDDNLTDSGQEARLVLSVQRLVGAQGLDLNLQDSLELTSAAGRVAAYAARTKDHVLRLDDLHGPEHGPLGDWVVTAFPKDALHGPVYVWGRDLDGNEWVKALGIINSVNSNWTEIGVWLEPREGEAARRIRVGKDCLLAPRALFPDPYVPTPGDFAYVTGVGSRYHGDPTLYDEPVIVGYRSHPTGLEIEVKLKTPMKWGKGKLKTMWLSVADVVFHRRTPDNEERKQQEKKPWPKS